MSAPGVVEGVLWLLAPYRAIRAFRAGSHSGTQKSRAVSAAAITVFSMEAAVMPIGPFISSYSWSRSASAPTISHSCSIRMSKGRGNSLRSLRERWMSFL